jgi:hypothetical protein
VGRRRCASVDGGDSACVGGLTVPEITVLVLVGIHICCAHDGAIRCISRCSWKSVRSWSAWLTFFFKNLTIYLKVRKSSQPGKVTLAGGWSAVTVRVWLARGKMFELHESGLQSPFNTKAPF